MKIRIVSALLMLALLSTHVAAQEPPLTNEECPVMVGEEVDRTIFTDYQGKRVYFCCFDCVDRFLADPTSYLPLLPQFAGEAAAGAASPEAAAPEDAVAATLAERARVRKEHKLGALHPAIVHFPVALGLAAALAALLSIVFRGAFFKNAATFAVVLAALTAVPSFLLGEPAEDLIKPMSEARHEAVEAHEQWGAISMYVLLGAAALNLLSRALSRNAAVRWAAVVVVLAAAGVVGYAGYLGGEVVRPGHLKDLLPF